MEIDPELPAYTGKPDEQIAKDIVSRGYRVVRYDVRADSTIRKDLVAALHRRGVSVWYTTFINGAWSTLDFPAGWKAWQMVTQGDLAGAHPYPEYTRLCLNHSAYRVWKKAQIIRVLRTIPFDGIDLKEPYWPEYPGPSADTYACFCSVCHAAFSTRFPIYRFPPDFQHPGSPRSPANDRGRFEAWKTFRREAIVSFLNDLVNGPGGIRQQCPGTKVCAWSLALSGPDGDRHIRDDYGLDDEHIVRAVRPDSYCLETDWPDWQRKNLPPTYVNEYRSEVRRIRRLAPSLPILIEADTGSPGGERHGRPWCAQFEKTCQSLGTGSSLYEFSLGG